MSAKAERYTAVAIVLHWAIAAAILFNIPLGLWMHAQAKAGNFNDSVYSAFQLHKSIGLTVLVLSLVRLGWRIANPPPPLPAQMPPWERFAALATHWAFYVLMISLPFTGWLYVSAGWSAETNQPLVLETHYFGLFTVPFLFGLTHASDAVRAATAHNAVFVHWLLGWTALGLVGLHVAAALKHQFVDRDEVLGHMVPGVHGANAPSAPKNPERSLALGAGLAVTALALIVACTALFSAPRAARPPLPPSTFTTVTDTTAATSTAVVTTTTVNTATTSTATTTATHDTTTHPTAPAAAWTVDAGASSIGFSLTFHPPSGGDQNFEGSFDRWRADIRFSPDDLAHSSATVTIEPHAADQMQSGQLVTTPWFDAADHPSETFRTTTIRHLHGDAYEAQGQLTLKGHTKAVTLPFTLTITGDRAEMSGTITVNRQDFDVGTQSDQNTSIGNAVAVHVRVVATRAS